MIGLEPATSAGNMNFTKMKPANPRPISEANPRHRATAITTSDEQHGEEDQRRSSLAGVFISSCATYSTFHRIAPTLTGV